MVRKPEAGVVSELKELFELLQSLDVAATAEALREFVQVVKDMKGMMFEIREVLNAKQPVEPPVG